VLYKKVEENIHKEYNQCCQVSRTKLSYKGPKIIVFVINYHITFRSIIIHIIIQKTPKKKQNKQNKWNWGNSFIKYISYILSYKKRQKKSWRAGGKSLFKDPLVRHQDFLMSRGNPFFRTLLSVIQNFDEGGENSLFTN